MNKNNLTTKQLADLLDINTETIRYYEKIGLLKNVDRDDNDYRVFRPEDMRLLSFVMACKTMGFTLKEIKTFIEDSTFDDIMTFKEDSYSIDPIKEESIKRYLHVKIKELDDEISIIENKKNRLKSFLTKMDNKDDYSDDNCIIKSKKTLDSVL